jgi:hypothetical protein
MNVDSNETAKNDDVAIDEIADGKSSTVDQSEMAAVEEEPSEKVSEEQDNPRATPPPVEEEDNKADESPQTNAVIASIPRFGRRAAQQANERIAARKERIIVDEFAKKKKQRKEKADLKLFCPADGKSKRGDDSDDDEGNWVQCDSCKKWRILPSSVDTSELPKHWYCEMNTFDPERSRCSAPEQSDQEILKERRRRKRKLVTIARLEAAGKIDAQTAAAQRLALDNKERKLARGKGRLTSRSPKPSKDSLDSECDIGKGKRKKRSSPTLEEDSVQGAESPRDGGDEQKSRSFKKQSSFSSRRSNKSETEDAGTEVETEPEQVPKKRGRGRPPRARANKDHDKEKSSKSDPDNQVSRLVTAFELFLDL